MRPLLISLLFSVAATVNAAEFPAALAWSETIILSTPLSGIVSHVSAKVGDRVKKGQLLAALDSRPYKAQLKRAKAQVQHSRSRFKDAEREYQRAQELFDRTVLSQTELQSSEVGFTTQQATYQRAEADLSLAKLNLEYSQIRAPFAGLVIENNSQVGEVVINKLKVTPMIRLALTNQIIASAWISFSVATTLEVGMDISILASGKKYPAIIHSLGTSSRATPSGSETLLEAKATANTFTQLPSRVATIITLSN
jgi:RND family efflux transporter MFP subunit